MKKQEKKDEKKKEISENVETNLFKSKSKKTLDIDFDKIKVGTKCGYSIAGDRYAYIIKEYKELPGNSHFLYLEGFSC